MFLYSAIGLEPRRVNTVNIQQTTSTNLIKSYVGYVLPMARTEKHICRGYLCIPYILSSFRQHNEHFEHETCQHALLYHPFNIESSDKVVRPYSILLRRPFPCHHVAPLVKRILGRCLQRKTRYKRLDFLLTSSQFIELA